MKTTEIPLKPKGLTLATPLFTAAAVAVVVTHAAAVTAVAPVGETDGKAQNTHNV